MYTIIYCFDAYCSWCYGMSPVINKLARSFRKQTQVEVLSGGMFLHNPPKHISVTADYLLDTALQVEASTGVSFGKNYLWHIRHHRDSDWFPDSLKPAMAICYLKEKQPDLQVSFAIDLQQALFREGRDLGDEESYRQLLVKYDIRPESFYQSLRSDHYKRMALEEFSLVKRLGVGAFPCLLLQESSTRLILLATGYCDYTTLRESTQRALDNIQGAIPS